MNFDEYKKEFSQKNIEEMTSKEIEQERKKVTRILEQEAKNLKENGSTYAQKLKFAENFVESGIKQSQELINEIAKNYELKDPKKGQNALINYLDEYEKTNFTNEKGEINYKAIGEKEAKNVIVTFLADDKDKSTLTNYLEYQIQEMKENNLAINPKSKEQSMLDNLNNKMENDPKFKKTMLNQANNQENKTQNQSKGRE